MVSVLKDPVCGMMVLPGTNLSLVWNGEPIHFCSEYCQDKFQQNPQRYLADLIAFAASDHKENRRVAYFRWR
jgi:glycogen phosphorylase